jgi:hypothetical protein
MPVVLSMYVHKCKLSMTRKNTRNDRCPFHPLMVDKILSTVLANKEITNIYEFRSTHANCPLEYVVAHFPYIHMMDGHSRWSSFGQYE